MRQIAIFEFQSSVGCVCLGSDRKNISQERNRQ
jgi:hypothetical protein